MADTTSHEQALRSDNGGGFPHSQPETLPEATNEQIHQVVAASDSVQRTASSVKPEAQAADDAPAPPLPPRPPASQVSPTIRDRQPVVSTTQAPEARQLTAKEMALQPHTHELRLLPPYNKNHSRIKLWMAMLLFSWGCAVVTISAIILAEFLKVYNLPERIDWICYFGIPFGALNMIWNAAELLTHCARGSDSIYPRGIHPGAHVGVHLIMLMGSAIGISFAAMSTSIFNGALTICNRPSNDSWWPTIEYVYNTCDYYKHEPIYWDGTVEYIKALLAACCVTFVIHFTLFVWGCVDTHHRNRLSLGGLLAPPAHAGLFHEMTMREHSTSMQFAAISNATHREPMQERSVVEGKVLQQPGNRMVHHGAGVTAAPNGT